MSVESADAPGIVASARVVSLSGGGTGGKNRQPALTALVAFQAASRRRPTHPDSDQPVFLPAGIPQDGALLGYTMTPQPDGTLAGAVATIAGRWWICPSFEWDSDDMEPITLSLYASH
jgi:hypothetical protein